MVNTVELGSTLVARSRLDLGFKQLTIFRSGSGKILASYKELAQLFDLNLKTLYGLCKSANMSKDPKYKAVPIEFADSLLTKYASEKLAAVNILRILNGSNLTETAVKIFDTAPVIQEDWLDYRKANRDIHNVFKNHCHSNLLPGGHVHDAMTLLVFNQTAKEARTNNEFVGLEEGCGLDYQHNAAGMKTIAKMKLKFCTYTSGTWQERVIRSYQDCQVDILPPLQRWDSNLGKQR
jgi:hypothetical protein